MSLLNIANEALERIRATKQVKTHRGIGAQDALSTVPGSKVIELSKYKPKRLTFCPLTESETVLSMVPPPPDFNFAGAPEFLTP